MVTSKRIQFSFYNTVFLIFTGMDLISVSKGTVALCKIVYYLLEKMSKLTVRFFKVMLLQ